VSSIILSSILGLGPLARADRITSQPLRIDCARSVHEISTLILPGAVALCLTLALTPVFRVMFHRWNILDTSDHTRRIHKTPIPRVGGMAMASALAIAAVLLWVFAPVSFTGKQLEMIWTIAPSAVIVFATGVLDDLFGLKAWQKLLGQLPAAGIACTSGIIVTGGWPAAPGSSEPSPSASRPCYRATWRSRPSCRRDASGDSDNRLGIEPLCGRNPHLLFPSQATATPKFEVASIKPCRDGDFPGPDTPPGPQIAAAGVSPANFLIGRCCYTGG
jgi:hypothetical protein